MAVHFNSDHHRDSPARFEEAANTLATTPETKPPSKTMAGSMAHHMSVLPVIRLMRRGWI